MAAERYNGPEPVNLGTGEEIKISNLAKMISEAVGFRGKILWDMSKPNGQPRRCLDVTRADAIFGFRAGHSLIDGIRKTIEWFKSENRQL